MGTSGAELNKPTSSMEFEHERTTYGNLNAHSCPAVAKVETQYVSNKILSPSSSSNSSSPDSPLNDPFGYHDDDVDDDDLFTPRIVSSPKHNSGESPFFESSVPKVEPSNHAEPFMVSIREPPPTQVMEHTTSSYRIPSSVFARSKSSTPMEWSVASNESLFSIHTGNMSFTKDHFFWRSGELGAPGETSTSGQIFSYSDIHSTHGKVVDTRSGELGLAEATMKEVIRESEYQIYEKKFSQGCISHRSHGSGTSTKSFAFSVVTGDVEKGTSMSPTSSLKAGTSLERMKSQQQTFIKQESQSKPDASAATGNVAPSKCFSCIPCWSLW